MGFVFLSWAKAVERAEDTLGRAFVGPMDLAAAKQELETVQEAIKAVDTCKGNLPPTLHDVMKGALAATHPCLVEHKNIEPDVQKLAKYINEATTICSPHVQNFNCHKFVMVAIDTYLTSCRENLEIATLDIQV